MKTIDEMPFDDFKQNLKQKTTSKLLEMKNDWNLPITIRSFVGFELGVRWKWWEDWNMKEPIPFPIMVDMDVMLENNVKFMSQLLARLEIFPSVGDAKKSGWNKPIERGEFFVKHDGFKKKRIIIE